MLRRETLSRAGKAFEGLEDLLGGGRSGTFDLQASAFSLQHSALFQLWACSMEQGDLVKQERVLTCPSQGC